MSNTIVEPVILDSRTDTEKRIFEAAKRVFVRKGMEGASMQDIATEAKISRTSLHYYFRSKTKLFAAVLDDLFARFLPQVEKIIFSNHSFPEKVARFVDVYLDLFLENSYLPGFIMNELSKNPEEIVRRFNREGLMAPRFQKQIQNDLRRHGQSLEASQFMMNLISLCVFPFIARFLVEAYFGDGRTGSFNRFIKARKTIIVDTLILSATPVKRGRLNCACAHAAGRSACSRHGTR